MAMPTSKRQGEPKSFRLIMHFTNPPYVTYPLTVNVACVHDARHIPDLCEVGMNYSYNEFGSIKRNVHTEFVVHRLADTRVFILVLELDLKHF